MSSSLLSFVVVDVVDVVEVPAVVEVLGEDDPEVVELPDVDEAVVPTLVVTVDVEELTDLLTV